MYLLRGLMLIFIIELFKRYESFHLLIECISIHVDVAIEVVKKFHTKYLNIHQLLIINGYKCKNKIELGTSCRPDQCWAFLTLF